MKKVLSLLLALCMLLCASAAFADAADTVIFGNIYTSEEAQPWAEAVAIQDGVFTYVGDAAGVEAFVGENTQVIRYEGGMVLPGLADAHSHGHSGGINNLFEVMVYEDETLEQYQQTLTEFIAANPDLTFINGAGWMNASFDLEGPTAAMLDEVCADKPIVLVSEDHHSYWANTKALEMAGITAETEDIPGGVISRNEDGSPKGCIRDNACGLIEAIIPLYTVEQFKEAILYYQDMVLSFGETLYFEPMVNLDGTETLLQAYNELDAEGLLKVRVCGGYELICSDTVVDEVAHVAELMEESLGGMFELTNIKILLDGVIEGRTAYLSEPYMGDDNYCGEILYDLPTLTELTTKANELGVTVHIHAIGDEAVTVALDAFEAAQAQTGIEDMRNAITHLQIVKPEDIRRMADLGVVAVANPYWFLKEPGYFHELEEPYLGTERAEHEYPMKDFFDAGAVVTCASDYPVTIPPSPLLAIQTGVIRMYPGEPETLLGEDQRVTIEQMLASATINAAFQMKWEDVCGSIAVGKAADLAVLDTDLTRCDPETIFDSAVLATMVNGIVAYENK